MTSHIRFLLGKVECLLLTQEVVGPSSLSPILMKGSGPMFFNYFAEHWEFRVFFRFLFCFVFLCKSLAIILPVQRVTMGKSHII